MGRKAKFDGTTVPTGPGRKARKQGDPTFPKGVLVKEEKELSHRQRQRARKRLLKQQNIKEKIKKLQKEKDKKLENTTRKIHSKSNTKQLKAKKKKKPVTNGNLSNENGEMQLDNDSIVSDNVEEMEDKQQISPKEKLFQSDREADWISSERN
ncbi:hypothetical protein ANTPLA_LOCUS8762 [Anthophora plagiata]